MIDTSRLSPAEKIELIALLEAKQRIQARSSLAEFAVAHIEMRPARHHKLIISELESLERGDIDVLFLFLPPGSAKSTFASVLFPAWFIGRNPGKALIAVSHTQELSERFGRRVRNTVASAEYQGIYPGVTVSNDSAAAGRWDASNGCEYFACGIGGSVTGRRADLGLVDDPVASREVADSETMRNKHWEWFINDFMTRLKPGAKLVFVMTRWHEDDLGGRALAYFGDRARVLKIPMEAGEDDPVGRAVGERLWPEWYTDDMVSLAKRDPRVWSALYQQEPRPGEGGEFRREWLRHYNDCKAGAGMNKILLVDPASGKRATNDYTSMWIIGLSSDSNYYVLDMVRDRLNLSERAEKVFSLHRKWKPYQVRYERYGMMADIEHMESCMDRENYRFKITEVGGGLKKEDRIRRTLPMFQDGKFYLPNTFWYTRTDGIVYDLVDEFINQEYLAFPVGRHDDMMDGLARIAEPGKDFELKWPGKSRTEFEPIKSYALLDSVAGY